MGGLEALTTEVKNHFASGGALSYISRKGGVHILFKDREDSPMYFAYICPDCGHEEAGESDEFKKPYTIKCSECGVIVYKQEKVKKGGGRKKEEPVEAVEKKAFRA
ncbi:MAG: hypothetical protein CL963_00655 [Euryarchaeota archaeon]|mgnify:CR=1 FL=1|jgi:DNA-directed RNA polymerase subunit RPC12/RpoP|nr:hypothetical protein [Euryarchaeota archaeon]|tara:strand:- start:46188 stop:46505 length:318 start_codon:yes stop_codon:yes gene_type:complete